MDILGWVEAITMLNVLKFLIVVLLSVYSIFAMLMMRQIVAMTRAVAMRDDFVIRLLGTINFGFALLVLILAIFIL